MSLIESELGSALHPAVKRKANKTGQLRLMAKRVAGGSSEVMVKVTGFGKGAGHVKAHLDYISRNGKVELEDDRGNVISGRESVKAFFKDWEKEFGDGKRHQNQRDTMHMVLSMPESTDPESVRRAVREFTKNTFGSNHEYVFALHTDEPHPHCHVTVKCLGFDGKRLNPRKADLQAWREGFAETLRNEGVDAEASPRRSRGVVRKPEPNVVRHIERGDKTHAPRVSKIRASKIKEAANELAAEAQGVPVAAKPWETLIGQRQAGIRSAWLAAAGAMEREDSRKTFNNQEARNERPDYDSISADAARVGQRAAAVYQSNLKKIGRQAPATSFPGVRNLSGVGMVHHQRPAEMLLQSNAPDRLGRRGNANSEVRRQGVGNFGAVGGAQWLSGSDSTAEARKALAGRIRGFVEAMPATDTERHQIKRDLANKFTLPVDKALGRGPQQPNNGGQNNDAAQAEPKQGSKDLDR